MQPRRRLRLAVVLLMAAGLTGGVALWHYSAQLNEEEQRLVGKWTGNLSGHSVELEFCTDHLFLLQGRDGVEIHFHWRLKNDRLELYALQYTAGFVTLPESLSGFAMRVPGANGIIRYRREVGRGLYPILWQGKNELVLCGAVQIVDHDRSHAVHSHMFRVPADK